MVETGRRRRWSDEEKLRIVAESYAGPEASGFDGAAARDRAVAADHLAAGVARRIAGAHVPGFSPVIVASDPAPLATPGHEVRSLTVPGRMEIELGNGRRVTVGADVDRAALARVLEGR